jgi:hypothetical protein
MKQQIARYWLAMNASAFDTTVNASLTYTGISLAHGASESIPALSLQQFGIFVCVTFGIAILKYIQANPIAKLFPPQA